MQIQKIVPEEQARGYWAEVRVLPGCMTPREALDNVIANVREDVGSWLAVDSSLARTTSFVLIIIS